MKHQPAPRFPGLPAIVDGSEAIAHVETRISEVACAYPITPSTTMAAIFQAAVADGRTNLWGTPLRFLEPESEHSSASAAEGLRARRRPGHELHGRPGPRPDEGGPLRHQRQATAGRLPRRRTCADQPGAQHPRRPRRRDGRRRHGLGDPLRPQRPGGGRPDRHRAARRRGDRDAVHRRPGRLPDDAHARERPAPRGRPAARVRRRSAPSGSGTCSIRPRR